MRFAMSIVLLSVTTAPQVARGDAEPACNDYERELLSGVKIQADTASLLKFVADATPEDIDPKTIPPLIARLRRESFAEREAAVKKLVAFGAHVLAAAREARGDNDPEVARQAKAIFDKVYGSRNPSAIAGLKVAIRVLTRRNADGTSEAIMRLLPTALDEDLIEECWYALDEIAVKRNGIAKGCRDQLRDAYPARRAAAGYLGARRGTPEDRAGARASDDRQGRRGPLAHCARAARFTGFGLHSRVN